jgi:hypothetical protein
MTAPDMSEYQYYEFRAIDRPLTQAEMAELRGLSTRASITPTSFQNEYNYGDFRGDPFVLMQKFFDAFVYVANWGTRQFMLRLPNTLLPAEVASRYTIEPAVRVHTSGNDVILELAVDEEEPEWAEGEGWLDSLVPLRDDIARGDLRSLYIGWLSAIWVGEMEDDEEEEDLREPPVPSGLNELSAPLQTLADFLHVDEDLLAVAAQRSPAVREKLETAREQEEWLQRLPDTYKNLLLVEVMQGKGTEARARLLQRFRQDTALVDLPSEPGGRTMSELLVATAEQRRKRLQREKQQAAEERERRAREEAAKREKYLQDLVGHQDATWARIEALLQTRRGPEYEQAARFVKDLRDVAQRQGELPTFTTRVRELRNRHASRPAFIRRLDEAHLP